MEDFKEKFYFIQKKKYPDNLYRDMINFLEEKNKKETCARFDIHNLVNSDIKLKETYAYNGCNFQINFDCEQNKRLIHASLNHLVTKTNHTVRDVIDITSDKKSYFLYHHKKLVLQCNLDQFYLLQGKLMLLIFNTIYQKREHDWIANFHASTISSGKEAIMCIGNSGKGKSTLTALLMAHGFELVADDISPLLQENIRVYKNPSAISIKEGAFDLLNEKFSDFKNIKSHFVNESKGMVKYLPPIAGDFNFNYSCKKVVLVNYNKHTTHKLREIPIEDALRILIPESWISPKKRNAKAFLKWIKSCEFYELSYSNTDEALNSFKILFSR